MFTVRRTTPVLGLLVCVLFLSACSPKPPIEAEVVILPCTTDTVQTADGPVCGRQETVAGKTLRTFKNIPYAESTAGDNRWKAPVPIGAWTEPFKATVFRRICPQGKEFPLPLPPQSEDCLSINVWTSTQAGAAADLPVMVFFYGGAFIDGASAVPFYDGSHLAARDVVVVSLNYRIGALGFLGGIGEITGNYGFLDQQLALKWVQRNIQHFGGDPEHVTIFGQSAGAMSVGLHALSAPGSKGLFKAALMESNPMSVPYKNMREAGAIGEIFKDFALGCLVGGFKCMREKSWQEVVKAERSKVLLIPTVFEGLKDFLSWAPVVDGTVITSQPVNGTLQQPTLLGSNRNEGIVFIFQISKGSTIGKLEYDVFLDIFFGGENARKVREVYPPEDNNFDVLSRLATDYLFSCGNRHVAQRAPGQVPVYAYEFDMVSHFNLWEPEGITECNHEVCHADELPYVFNTADTLPGVKFKPDEEKLSLEMGTYWTNFGKPGHDPNGPVAPALTWPTFSAANPEYMIFDSTLTTRTDPPHNCAFWDTIGYVDIHPHRWAEEKLRDLKQQRGQE